MPNRGGGGVDPPLCSSRACLHTAFTAMGVQTIFVFSSPQVLDGARARALRWSALSCCAHQLKVTQTKGGKTGGREEGTPAKIWLRSG